jgi:hypothetical protein
MSDVKPWYPNLVNGKEFVDHKNPLGDTPQIKVPDATEDTSPLQGSKDLSDADSLEDVIADSFDPDAESPEALTPKNRPL